MELEFDAEQDALRDGIRAVLARECPPSLPRAVAEKGVAADGLWATVAELGWPALAVPEGAGGLGRGAVEVAILAEELGRALAPGPTLATAAQFVPLVRDLGDPAQQTEFLGAVAAGAATGTVAVAEPGTGFDPAEVRATATPDGDGYVLAGEKRFVLDGDAADRIAAVVRAPGTDGDRGVAVAVVPGAACATEAVRSFDPTRRYAHVRLDGVRVPAPALLAADGGAVRRALETATVAVALETVGACQTLFDRTLEYARQRVQFGVPIGSFQAVKHKFADMAVALERARSTGYLAALTIAEDDPRRASATSVAKVAAGDCQRLVAKEGIQLHGGIGMTWEHDVHLYVKRAQAGEVLLGTSAWHRERLASLLLV